MRGVGGVRKSVDQNRLAKGLGLLCRGLKGVQEEIPSEEASTLQIGSVAFLPGQCTSPQLHPCHRLFDQDWHQDSFMRVLSIKVPIRKKSGNLFNDTLWFVILFAFKKYNYQDIIDFCCISSLT